MEDMNQGNNKPVETRTEANGVDTRLVFGDNRHFSFVYKKTEKLVTAVYMITNFIKDNEPLKWKIRENALSLMSLNIAFNTVSLSERKSLLKEYHALSLEIVSLSSIAFHSGLISEMNFHILAREFGNLVSVIEKDENKRASEETVILDPGFFDTQIKETPKTSTESDLALSHRGNPEPVLYKGHINRPVGPASVSSSVIRPSESPAIKDTASERPAKVSDSKDRQSVIIKLLSKKSGLGIKDFAQSIKGVSEKTIQRELLSMVASGVLKKEGERRWSTYSLSNPAK